MGDGVGILRGGVVLAVSAGLALAAVAPGAAQPESSLESEPFVEATMSADPIQGTHDWIAGYDFAPDTTLTLTVDAGSGPVAVSEPPTTDADGGFRYDPPTLDLLSGDVVAVSDGTAVVSLTLVGLTFDAVDFDQDTAVGTTDQPPGTEVGVVAVDASGAEEVLVVASVGQRWSAQFTVDVTPAFSLWAFVLDPDLDGATVAEPLPPAHLQASTANDPTTGEPDTILGSGFAPETDLSMYLNGHSVSDGPITDAAGAFAFDDDGTLDLRSGDRIWVTDGTATRRLTVVGLTFDALDYATDSASGSSDQPDGTPVSVELGVAGGTTERADTAVASGTWTATFLGDVTTASVGCASIADSDDDLTVACSPTPPSVQVRSPSDPLTGGPDVIVGHLFTPATPMSIRVNDLDLASPPTTDGQGSFQYESTSLDLRPGDVLEVSDGVVPKTLTLVGLTVDTVDYVADSVSGHSDQPDGTTVTAIACREDGCAEPSSGIVTSGEWTAVFAADIRPEHSVDVLIRDDDEDATVVVTAPPAQVLASVANDPAASFPTPRHPDSVAGTRFAATTPLSISINGVAVPDPPTSDGQGSFVYGPEGLDLAVGDVVEVTDGSIARTMTLPALTFDVLEDFTVAGTSSTPDGTVVYVTLVEGGTHMHTTATVTAGAWSVEIFIDLRFVAWAEASTIDADGDVVVAPFNRPLLARPGDFDGDGTSDPAVYRDGAWFVEGMPTEYLGLAEDVPVPADYAGEQRVRPAVFRDGPWFISGQETMFYGLPGDVPVPGTYWPYENAVRGLFRRGTWFLTGSHRVFLGLAGDVPVPADYDGDQYLEPAVFRGGRWYIQDQPVMYFGLPGDVPVPGDYDGDGAAEPAVFRDGRWYVVGQPVMYFGLPGDVPVPGDYDGDGDVEPAVFRGGQWHIRGQPTRYLGLPGDVPVVLPAAIYTSTP